MSPLGLLGFVGVLLLNAAPLVLCAPQEFPFASIVSQDPFPDCETRVVCNGEYACGDICVPGSVVVDPFYSFALGFQRDLQGQRALPSFQFVGSHNAFISRANGLGSTEDLGVALFAATLGMNMTTLRVPDQRYAVADLLNLGVRHIEADIWSADIVSGPAIICHSPVPDPLYVLLLQESADALGLGPLGYEGFGELCARNLTFLRAMGGIREWLEDASVPGRERELVVIYLDNRVPDYNIETVVGDVGAAFQGMLLTPGIFASRYGGVWPSRDALVADGYRVIVESGIYNPNNYSRTNLTQVAFFPVLFDQLGPLDFLAPFPNCTLTPGSTAADWYGDGKSFVRILEGNVVWAPEYDERTGGVIFEPNGALDMLSCGLNNLAFSEFGPQNLPGLVWSWLYGEPNVGRALKRGGHVGSGDAIDAAAAANCTAAAMTTVRGRWALQACGMLLPALCRLGPSSIPSGDKPASWSFSEPTNFTTAAAACAAKGAQWAFDLPRDGRENALVANTMLLSKQWAKNAHGLWLNYQS